MIEAGPVNDLAVRMAALKVRYRARAGEDAVRVAAALTPLDRTELLRVSHAIVGSAGMFGFTDLGAAAARVEDAIDADEEDDRVTALAADLVSTLNRTAQPD